jgi:hypothetical protein
MRVDEARHDDHTGSIHSLRVIRVNILANCGDRRTLDQDVSISHISTRTVERKHIAAFYQHPASILRRAGIGGEDGFRQRAETRQCGGRKAREHGASVGAHPVDTVCAAGAYHGEFSDEEERNMLR